MKFSDELSQTIKPGDDFFHYVNKTWLDAHPIPDDKSAYGAFVKLNDDNLAKLIELLQSKIEASDGTLSRIAKQYYQSAIDESAIAKATPQFVGQLTSTVNQISDRTDLNTYIAEQFARGIGPIWELIVEPDNEDSQHYTVRLWQGGLGLPERTYYLEDTPSFKAIRKKYHEYLTKLFALAGLDLPEQRADRVYDLELKLAQVSLDAAELRDPVAMNNPYTINQLQHEFPAITWAKFIEQIGCPRINKLVVGQPVFTKGVNQLLAQAPIEQWRDYLIAHQLYYFMSKLDKRYEDLSFDFFGKILKGSKRLEPRAMRMSRMCLATLPEPVGQLYIEHFFDESAKTAIEDLVAHIQTAMGSRIDQLEWMGPSTKQQAHDKLTTFLPLLGYPEQWRSYDALELGHNFAQNYLAISTFENAHELNKLTQPVDRKEWIMSPALVNACYWPNTNSITFPAAILQPPFFDAQGDVAANYGGIGAVIGHEITHGFDDEGSQYDANGTLKSWWSKQDRAAFDKRAKQLVEHYNGFELIGRHVNGQLTLGENIADLGGLLIAFDALQNKLAETGQRQNVNGLTPEQRFFLSYALTGRLHTRDETMLQRLLSDPHSPEIFRVNGVVPNIDAFYQAFNVVSGDKLYIAPEQRVRIW